MNYTLYNIKTGQITGTTNDIDRAKNENYILGLYDGNNYYIVDNKPVRKPSKPVAHSYFVYDFDYSTGDYVLNLPETIKSARQFRDMFFRYVDKVSPMWYNSMTPQQQQEVTQYRQQLLDVTKQSDFPINIIWPTVPDFLRN